MKIHLSIAKCFFKIQIKRKRRRSDPVLWQKPLYQQKIRNQRTTHTNATKNFDYTTIAENNWTIPYYYKNNSLLLEVLTSVFTVSSYFRNQTKFSKPNSKPKPKIFETKPNFRNQIRNQRTTHKNDTKNFDYTTIAENNWTIPYYYKNNSLLLEVLTSVFTVSSYFPENPRIWPPQGEVKTIHAEYSSTGNLE